MIITDGVHMVSTISEGELHNFAACVGLKREWYQNHLRHPHYDITRRRKLYRVLAHGAKEVTTKELIRNAWWWPSRKEIG